MPSASVAKLTMWVPPYAVRPVSLATCWLSLTTASGSGTKVSSMPRRVRTTPGGFALEYTQPLSTQTAADHVEHYKVKQWRYVPTADYGGPKVDEETLAVQSATLSADGRTVSLAIPGL